MLNDIIIYPIRIWKEKNLLELTTEQIELNIFQSFLEGDPQNIGDYLTSFPEKRSQVLHSVVNDLRKQAINLELYDQLVQQPSLMIVEDDPDIQAWYYQLFKKSQFTKINHAADGQTAIDIYEQLVTENKKPALILLDYNLPLISGLEVALHIRSLDPLQPILFVTANIHVLHACSFHDSLQNIPVLAKPFASKALINTISKLLNK